MLTMALAKKVGTTAETVRFYTRKGLITATKNPDNGYKIYNSDALTRLQFIIHARNIGFSLSQIEEIIDHSEQGKSPCPKVRKMLSNRIDETRQKIKDYQHHLALMEKTYADWQLKDDMVPDGKAICCLIEDWSDQHQDKLPKDNNSDKNNKTNKERNDE